LTSTSPFEESFSVPENILDHTRALERVRALEDNHSHINLRGIFMPSNPRKTVSPAESRSPLSNSTIDFDTVRSIGLALPGVEQSTSYGLPALKIHGKFLAGIPARRSQVEPGSLGVCVDFEDRAELIGAAPDIYYVTEHYLGYNVVLVRLARIDRDMLRDLLGMAYKFVTRNATARKPPQKRRKPLQ
jgi:hypothetical protein